MSALKICPTCGTEYPANERFCPRDGAALRTQGGGTDLVGSIIAERYHVIRKLGEGGMGQVYLAEHVKMGRKSAVKVMNPGMVNDADAISRFNREAANASRINHPNVAGIYDFGETADGLIFLAMEFIEGEPLTELVESTGALPPMRAADIARQAADALTVAHEMGIVHRDLKPDNIMIAKNRDGSDCVKVVDFGIAKAADNQAQKVTRTGLVVGTPEYMSPEQLAGDKLDGRSDVYSLALVAFHMLTGLLPFPSETAQESMIMRLTDKPRSLVDMKADTPWPPEVQAVMDRALERDAKLRYQTANDFGRALYAALATMDPAGAEARTSVIETVPPTRVDGAVGAPVKRKRRGPILFGVGLAALLVAAVAYVQQNGSAVKAVPAVRPLAAAVRPDSSAAWGPESALKAPRTVDGSRAPVLSTSLAGTAPEKRENPAAATAPADVPSQVAALVTRSADSLAARDVLDEVRVLQSRASSNADRAGLGLARAQALAFLRREDEACTSLKSVRRMSVGTKYQSDIDRLLQYSTC